MKKDIHPQYFPKASVTCACGNKFTIGSTMETLEVEICSSCHPFYTGKQKLVDTAGMVDKYQARAAKQEKVSQERKGKKIKKAAEKKRKTAKEDAK